MPKLSVSKAIIEKAVSRTVLDANEQGAVETVMNRVTKGSVSAEVSEFPMALLKSFLEDARLTANQRAIIALQVHGMVQLPPNMEEIYELEAMNPLEFGSSFALLGCKSPNCEYFWNGRWYPIIMKVEFHKGDNQIAQYVSISADLAFSDMTRSIGYPISKDLFLDEGGNNVERSVIEILHKLGLRKLQTPPGEFNIRLLNSERTSQESGIVYLVKSSVLAVDRYFGNVWTSPLKLGTEESPRKVVVEPELESNDSDGRFQCDEMGPMTPASTKLSVPSVFSSHSS